MKSSETKTSFDIQGLRVGESSPCFIIAEIAQAHDGSLGAAHAYIDAVAKVGANAIKFQTHIANAESSPDEKFRINCFPQDASRFEYWKRMEFSLTQWRDLAMHALDKGLVFLSSPFSMEAVDLLDELDIADLVKGKRYKCGNCAIAYYCDKRCQTMDWVEHKKTCCLGN